MTPTTHSVTPDTAGRRLDHFLAETLADFSRMRLQAFIREGHVLVNGRAAKTSQILRDGDRVEVSLPTALAPATAAPEPIPIDVLFEDNAILVVNKPAGLVVHPGAGNLAGTLVNALLHHCSDLSGIGGVERPGIIHRLDKETSGCLAIAKTDAAHRELSAQFASRTVEKTYLALVEGKPRMPHGTIEAAITRHAVHRQKMTVGERGRQATTHYRVLASDSGLSLVSCMPKTGRTHQIRVHLKHLGHPVVGDPLYGRRGQHHRHFLHAWKLAFTHPVTGGRRVFCAPLPPDFPAWAQAAAPSGG